jgi:hypothetical protein
MVAGSSRVMVERRVKRRGGGGGGIRRRMMSEIGWMSERYN